MCTVKYEELPEASCMFSLMLSKQSEHNKKKFLKNRRDVMDGFAFLYLIFLLAKGFKAAYTIFKKQIGLKCTINYTINKTSNSMYQSLSMGQKMETGSQ